MRFFGPMPPRGHRGVSEARAGSCLHVALIVRLPAGSAGLETGADSVGDRRTNRGTIARLEAAADFGHRDSSLAVDTQLKGIRFLIVFDGSERTRTGLFVQLCRDRNRVAIPGRFEGYSSGSCCSSSASASSAASRASASGPGCSITGGKLAGWPSNVAAGCVAAWTCCNVRMATCV